MIGWCPCIRGKVQVPIIRLQHPCNPLPHMCKDQMDIMGNCWWWWNIILQTSCLHQNKEQNVTDNVKWPQVFAHPTNSFCLHLHMCKGPIRVHGFSISFPVKWCGNCPIPQDTTSNLVSYIIRICCTVGCFKYSAPPASFNMLSHVTSWTRILCIKDALYCCPTALSLALENMGLTAIYYFAFQLWMKEAIHRWCPFLKQLFYRLISDFISQ